MVVIRENGMVCNRCALGPAGHLMRPTAALRHILQKAQGHEPQQLLVTRRKIVFWVCASQSSPWLFSCSEENHAVDAAVFIRTKTENDRGGKLEPPIAKGVVSVVSTCWGPLLAGPLQPTGTSISKAGAIAERVLSSCWGLLLAGPPKPNFEKKSTTHMGCQAGPIS
eukprot:1155358-Pelagomonas_calceolata.AAC.3